MKQNAILDVLTFRRMISPIFIQIVFWLGVVATIIGGVVSAGVMVIAGVQAEQPLMMLGGILIGLAYVVLGPLLVRLYCEILILFFRMNESLTDIANNTRQVAEAMAARPGGY